MDVGVVIVVSEVRVVLDLVVEHAHGNGLAAIVGQDCGLVLADVVLHGELVLDPALLHRLKKKKLRM